MLPCSLGLLLLLDPRSTPADEPEKAPALKQALALQDLVQRVIRAAEPSVACVVVSRSDAYQRYGQGPSMSEPGKLGAFAPAALEARLPRLDAAERERIRKQLDLADPATVPESYGSGVVLDEAGLLLTNYHVVLGATKIFVRLPGGIGSYADIHAADPRSDLAVLRLLEGKGYKALRLGDGGKAESGQFVVALANPFAAGFRDGQPSASFGIISNVRRRSAGNTREEESAKSLHQYGTLLQTDVRLNLGCSGGALLNLKGELIGLTTSLAALRGSDAPGGFAVPIDAGLRRILDVLKLGREVEYGFLGISFDRKATRGDGVVLSWVIPGSPADRKGLQKNDVLLAINGTPLRTGDDLFLALGTLLAGSTAVLDVQKGGGGRARLEVTLAKFYVPGKKIASDPAPRPYFRGLRVDDASLLVQQGPRGLAPRRIPVGVLISEVRPESPAATALLRSGDVITHVNGRAVTTPAAFYREARGLSSPVELTLAARQPGQLPARVVLN
jgi:S1-C subfamily serine protease